MRYTTEWTLYRHGEETKLAITYTDTTSPTGIDSQNNAHNTIRILNKVPNAQLTQDEWDDLMLHCLTDLDLNLGNALLAELDAIKRQINFS